MPEMLGGPVLKESFAARKPQPVLARNSDEMYKILIENNQDMFDIFARVKAAAPDMLEYSTEKGRKGCVYINVQINTDDGIVKNLVQINTDNELIVNGTNHSRDPQFGDRQQLMAEVLSSLSASVDSFKPKEMPMPAAPKRERLVLRNPKNLDASNLY